MSAIQSRRFTISRLAVLWSAATLAAMGANRAMPSEESSAAENGTLEEVIVTARKRQESIMRTPVDVQAFTAQQITELKIEDFKDLASVTPGLYIMTAFGTVGNTVYLRGLGSGEGANFADQAVLLNVDGISLTHGAFYRQGMFDTKQVEVMKGPQALFFGRSSSAGIVAVSSADPTPTWTTQTRVGYEFVADEVDVDGFVAGPLTDKLGIRFAGYRNQMKGWMLNNNYDGTPTPARRIPDEEDYGGRLTLKYDDRDIGFDAKLKVALARVASDMWSGDVGQHICLGAKAQNVGLPADNCVADNITQGEQYPNPYNPNVDWANSYGNTAAFATGDSSPLFTGRGYTSTQTTFVALNMDYNVAPSLTLTSVSGYDKLTTKDVGRHSQLGVLPPATPGGPYIPYSYTFDLAGVYQQEDYSQELRLASDWNDRWFNFMLGAFYTTGTARNTTILDVPSATFINNFGTVLQNKVYSGFGQILLTPIAHWEFSAGVRYTDVKKHISSLTYFPNTFAFYPPNTVVGQLAGVIPSEFTSYEQKNTSPEVTVTFRPTDAITEFISYKYGYKGPGLNVNAFTGTYAPGQVNFYGGEKVHGVEAGVKASLLDRHLSLTATAYDYKYSSLQVSFYNGENFTTETSNGADANVRGVEFGVNFNPTRISGLNVNGNINYNKADFSTFRGAPCYTGQTAAQGCVGIGAAAAQDLSGKQLPRAPRWTGDAGLEYHAHVSDKYSAALNAHANFSSSYHLDSHFNPLAFEKSYVTFDAGLRFGKLDGPWEVALIGRNLSNKYVLSGGSDDGVAVPPNIADALVYVFRGRQVQLQFTMRPDIAF